MGLDMYLVRKTYVKNWEHMSPEEKHTITITGPAASWIQESRISEVVEEVAYWRKFNALHNWFVNRCQNGVDDCRDAYVEREVLEELVQLLTDVLNDPDSARERFPPQSGFFFGSTEIDDWYWSDVRETRDLIEKLLKETPRSDYYYHSSW
jgi:hypothetical protein